MKYLMLILLISFSLIAYPVMEDVPDREVSVGDSMYFVISGDSWQHNNLVFEMTGNPEGAELVNLGYIGGCYCSMTEWGARFIFYVDSSVAGDHYDVEFTCIDTLGATDRDTMHIYILPIPPILIEPLPDIAVAEHDTYTVALEEHFRDPDGDFSEMSFNISSSGIYEAWVTEDAILKVANPEIAHDCEDIIVEAMDEDSATVCDTFNIVFNYYDDPPVIEGLPESYEINSSEELIIELNEYATDPDTDLEALRWEAYGADFVEIEISDRSTAAITPITTESAVDTAFFVLIDTGRNADTAAVIINIIADAIEEKALPENIEIGKLYPNPFNSRLCIETGTEDAAEVMIFNIKGKLMRHYPSAKNSVIWDGCDDFGNEVPGGIYNIVIEKGKSRCKKKALFIK